MRTAHLAAELLVVAFGALVQTLRVMQQLLNLPHLPLAAPQLAFQLLYLPPQLGQLRLGGGGWRWWQRGRRRLGGHGVRREAARGRGGAVTQTEVDAGGPRSHGSARVEKGGLIPARPHRPLAMTPLSSLPGAERNCGQARGRRPAQSARLWNKKTLFITTFPSDLDNRSFGEVGGPKKQRPKASEQLSGWTGNDGAGGGRGWDGKGSYGKRERPRSAHAHFPPAVGQRSSA